MVIILLLVGLAVVAMIVREQGTTPASISYDEFIRQIKADNIASVEITGNQLDGEFRKAAPGDIKIGEKKLTSFRLELSDYVGKNLDTLLLDHDVRLTVKTPTDGTGFLLAIYLFLPLMLMAVSFMR